MALSWAKVSGGPGPGASNPHVNNKGGGYMGDAPTQAAAHKLRIEGVLQCALAPGGPYAASPPPARRLFALRGRAPERMLLAAAQVSPGPPGQHA